MIAGAEPPVERGRRLSGRVVAVTGGGAGLGLLTTCALLEQGAQVIANYRSSSEALAELARQYPAALHMVSGDIAEEQTSVDIAAYGRELGRLDVLVHNAGISRDRPLIAMSLEEWDEVIRVNLRGAFLSTQHALRVMMRRRYGRLIYVSSLAAVVGNAGQANYAASKGALHGLSNVVAQEYGSRGIRSVVVAPGVLDTGIGAKLRGDILEAKAERQLLGVGSSESVAATIAFLASGDADFINAAVIHANGGLKY